MSTAEIYLPGITGGLACRYRYSFDKPTNKTRDRVEIIAIAIFLIHGIDPISFLYQILHCSISHTPVGSRDQYDFLLLFHGMIIPKPSTCGLTGIKVTTARRLHLA